MEELAVLRPARFQDLNSLISFSQIAGIGITSLPQNPQILETKLRDVEFAFSHLIVKPRHETYLFCLEWKNEVIGISGITSRVGMTEPFFSYHLLHESIRSPFLGIDREIGVLHFIRARKKPTELGTLFVHPKYRNAGHGFGKLLSFSRFLFIATFRIRFAPIVIAELRGYNDNGSCPFWDAVGRPFFDIGFHEADYLRTAHPEIIEELFPKHPIYIDLLSSLAKDAVGKLHPDTVPALKILEKQGFKMSGYYDIFDAGPHVFAPTEEIHAVKESKIVEVDEIVSEITPSKKALLSNMSLDFRACQEKIEETSSGKLRLSKEVADALKVKKSDTIRYYVI